MLDYTVLSTLGTISVFVQPFCNAASMKYMTTLSCRNITYWCEWFQADWAINGKVHHLENFGETLVKYFKTFCGFDVYLSAPGQKLIVLIIWTLLASF